MKDRSSEHVMESKERRAIIGDADWATTSGSATGDRHARFRLMSDVDADVGDSRPR